MRDLQITVKCPEELIKIVEYLKKNPIRLPRGKHQGRSESTVQEEQVVRQIRKKFNITTLDHVKDPWADFYGRKECGEEYPVNIKISSLKGADNTCGKIALLHTFSNSSIKDLMNSDQLAKVNQWADYFEYFNENLSLEETGKDYYFLIIDKSQTSNVFYTSLRGLQCVTPNGSNFPFQCNWKRNQTIVERTYKEALEFILDSCEKSLLKSPVFTKHKNIIKMKKRII